MQYTKSKNIPKIIVYIFVILILLSFATFAIYTVIDTFI
jgi:hypothetical protein